MKSFGFRKNDTVFRYLKEKKTPGKKRNYDRIIYIVILSLIVLFFGKYFFYKTFYVEAEGLVLMDRLEIRNTEDCRLKKIYVNEGDTVMLDDTLFTYSENLKASQDSGSFSLTQNTNSAWPQKEIANTQKSIELKKMDIDENRKLIQRLRKIIEETKNQVILGLQPKSKLDAYNTQLEELTFETEKNKKEIDYLTNYLNDIRDLELQTKNLYSNTEKSNGNKAFLCPIDSGFVTSISKKDFEVALKSEEILTIHKHKEVVIKAFFDQSDLKFIRQGRQVTVEFPDGTTGKGVIKNIFSATSKLPEEFQKKYESTTRSLTVDIVPISASEFSRWNYFYKMSVKIYVVKYSIL